MLALTRVSIATVTPALLVTAEGEAEGGMARTVASEGREGGRDRVGCSREKEGRVREKVGAVVGRKNGSVC